ncbi:MAG: NAD(P)-dependent oxidoreductase [Haloarculaceae archaeon]
MTDATHTCLLCGDPQQPSEAMYDSAGFLEEHGVSFERMEWRGDASGAEFRDVTMDMESRGPNDYDASAIAERLDGVEFLVVHKAPVSRTVFERGADLEVVAAARGGVENVDLEAARDHGVTVLHAPGRNADAVADYAVAFALAAHRRIPHFVETTGRGEWDLTFDPAGLPRDVTNLTVGIVGFGNVGRNVGRRWAGFDPDLLVHDPFVDDGTIRESGAEPASLDDLLANADVVTLHARLTDETRHLLDADAFARMDEDALLVNTARGGLVETDALVAALEAGAIGGAALDVFEEEPIPADHPLLDLDDVLLSPHTAGSTRDAVYNGARIVADDLLAIVEGREPAHRIE